jgi:hypothetical protein
VVDSNNGHSMSLENVDDLIVGNDASKYTSADDGDGNSITKPSAFDNNAEETAEAEFDIDECAMDDLQMNGKKSRTIGIFMETQDEDVSVVESLTRSVEAEGEESATEEEEEAPANTGPSESDRSKLKKKVVQSLIDHTYYNYSLVNVYEELSRRSSQGQYKNPNRKGLTTNFPAKLHKILSNPEFRHIIRWMVRAMCVFMSVTKMSRLHSDQFMRSRVHSPSHPFPFALMSNMSRSLASRYQNSSSSLMAARGLWLIKI